MNIKKKYSLLVSSKLQIIHSRAVKVTVSVGSSISYNSTVSNYKRIKQKNKIISIL